MKQKRTKISVNAINGDLTFSDKSVWLWVKIPPTPYEFLDNDTREQSARSMDIALATLLTSDEKPLECQLIVTNSPFDSVEWVNELYKIAARDNPSDELVSLLNEMENRVHQIGFKEKQVYLGVKLGNRTEFSATGGSFLPLTDILNVLTPAFGVKDYSVSEKEIDFWDKKAKLFRRSLINGHLRGEKVYAEEIAYIIKKPFFPAMPMPPVDVSGRQDWGLGELDYLTDGRIENFAKHLKITQEVDGEEKVGYRATLCFSKFPDVLYYPQQEPWIHFSSSLSFPIDFYSRFTLEPARKVRKEVGKKLAEVKDQAQNMTSAGGSLNIDIQERLRQGTNLDYELSQDAEPWVYARHRITVEAETEDELKERVREVIDHYRDLGITVTASTGDQMNLLLESMPNDYIRMSAYYQRQQISIISAGTPAGTGKVGNQKKRLPNGDTAGFLGTYIGYTTSRVLTPVFLSAHSTIAEGLENGILLTGSPGSGKSNLAFTLTYYMTLMGCWGIFIDPKGDSLPMLELPGMKEKTTLFDVTEGADGILDPFNLGETLDEQVALADQLINMFLGNKIPTGGNVSISKALKAVSERPEPSLGKVVEFLIASREPVAKDMGIVLDKIRNLPLSRLCFKPAGVNQELKMDKGLTLITLRKLNLPGPDIDPENYETSHQLAVAIMFLLTSYTRNLLFNTNKNHPKFLGIDEASVLTSTKQGIKMISEVVTMGRAFNTAIILISQNSKEFEGSRIENSLSTRIAFKANSKDEIDNLILNLGIEDTPGNRSVIKSLDRGECLIRDGNQRVAKVTIDRWNPLMMRAFESNPERRRRQEEYHELGAPDLIDI